MENEKNIILATLTGVASGVILGLLLAPEEGSKTRKKITKKGEEYLDEIKKEVEGLRKELNKRSEATKDEVSQYRKSVKHKAEDIQKKIKKFTSYDEWTKDELYQKAKEASIEGYSTMNKGELIDALRKG